MRLRNPISAPVHSALHTVFEEWKKVTPRPGMLVLDGDTITWNGEPLYWEGI